MEKHSSACAYLTSLVTAVLGGLTVQELALWVGIVTTLGTFLVNWYYKEREADLAEARSGKCAQPCAFCTEHEQNGGSNAEQRP